jgi:hypothetical protein
MVVLFVVLRTSWKDWHQEFFILKYEIYTNIEQNTENNN